MEYEFFTFRSITRGQLALRYLLAADVTAVLMRAPRQLSQEGCAYAIRVQAADAAWAAQIFDHNAVLFQRRFHQSNGRYWEVGQ